MFSDQNGFTLLELLVVIGILTVLVAVVALSISRFIGRGACESYCVEKHDLQTAITAYMAHHGGAVPNLDQAKIYLIGDPKYAWTEANIGADGLLSDAEDKPAGCVCGGD